MNDKKTFIKSFFPDTVEDVRIVPIDLDVAGLTLCDILRNINSTFHPNTQDRFAMIDGRMIVAVICRSDLIEPLNGIVLLVGRDVTLFTESKNYILVSVDERDIKEEDRLNEINDSIIMYLAKLLRGCVRNFDEFYNVHLYNDYEELQYEEDDDD